MSDLIQPVSSAGSLCRIAAQLYDLAEYCRSDGSEGLQMCLRIEEHCRQLLAAAGAVGQSGPKVAVVGDFDAGKSTLISALAGRELLPMHPNPATALVTWISHGADEAHSLCPAGEAVPRALTEAEFRRLHHGGIAEGEAGAIDHLAVRLPLPLLERGTTLLDTPGFDNGPDDTARTLAVIAECGGLVFCTPAIHPLSERDLTFLKALFSPEAGRVPFHPGQLFLVITFADAGQFEDDPELMGVLMGGLRTRLVSLAGLDEATVGDLMSHRCVAVSGKRALRARLSQDQENERLSGIGLLEQRLDAFFRSLPAGSARPAGPARAATARFVAEISGELQAHLQRADQHLQRREDEQRHPHQQERQRLEQMAGCLRDAKDELRLLLIRYITKDLSLDGVKDVTDGDVRELARRAAQRQAAVLLRYTPVAKAMVRLQQSLLSLPDSGPDWRMAVREGLDWLSGALENWITAALSESPAVEALARAQLGRRGGSYTERCEAVLAAIGAVAPQGVVDSCFPALFEGLALRLQEQTREQVRQSEALLRQASDLESGRRRAQQVLDFLKDLQTGVEGS